MCELKKAIAQIENDMELDSKSIKHEHEQLNTRISNSPYLFVGLAGAFLFGVLSARAKNRGHLVGRLTGLASRASSIYNKVKIFL
jgi:hypothetical protein